MWVFLINVSFSLFFNILSFCFCFACCVAASLPRGGVCVTLLSNRYQIAGAQPTEKEASKNCLN